MCRFDWPRACLSPLTPTILCCTIVCDEMADRCMCESKARQGDADAKGGFCSMGDCQGGCSNGYLQMQMRINRSKLELELEKRIACMLSKLCGL